MRFDLVVAPGGYAWWYLDALSEDGTEGLTVIAFIGSVFSPYYAWSGRGDPLNHCALNVALYRPRAGRWAMTERGRGQVALSPERFQVHNSALHWDGTRLEIEVSELCAPIPHRLRGTITVNLPGLFDTTYTLDKAGRHRWRPLSPCADVTVDFSEPDLHWRGRGYLDCNQGDEPLEAGFRIWDWCRAEIGPGETAILYNTTPRRGEGCNLALRFTAETCEPFALPPPARLPDTRIWRIARPARADAGTVPRHVRSFEDTPFYSRSVIETSVLGAPRLAVHESLVGDRLASPVVKAMLPFRMPRITF